MGRRSGSLIFLPLLTGRMGRGSGSLILHGLLLVNHRSLAGCRRAAAQVVDIDRIDNLARLRDLLHVTKWWDMHARRPGDLTMAQGPADFAWPGGHICVAWPPGLIHGPGASYSRIARRPNQRSLAYGPDALLYLLLTAYYSLPTTYRLPGCLWHPWLQRIEHPYLFSWS